jgi:DNA-binding transcriptional LysR family regulator
VKFSLPQLEALLWIVRLGSFRAAAARLKVSQPAVSVRVRELEVAAGGKLFLRDSYRAKPTPLGRELAAEAERILETCEVLEARLGQADVLSGPIRIGVADSFAMTHLPELLRRIEKRFPKVRAEIRVDFSVRLDRSLAAGDLDIAVLTAPTLGGLTTVEPLMPLELQWVVAPGFPLRTGTLRPADLAGVPIITNPKPSNLYTSITRWFASAGVEAQRIHTCNSLVIMMRLACEGAGASLLPAAIVEPEVEAKSLRILKVRPSIPPHPLAVAYRRDAPGSGMKLLAGMVHELVAPATPAASK